MRFALRLAALAAGFGLAGAAPSDPLAAVASANGHAGAVHFRALSTRTVEGRVITTAVEQLGALRLLRRCIAGVCGGVWFDGVREWTFGLNEVALPEDTDDATLTMRTLFAIDSYAFAEPSFHAAGGTVTAAGSGRWRVRAHDGAELVAILDGAAAVRRVETPAGRSIAEYGRETRAGGATFALDRRGPFADAALDEVSVTSGPIGPPPGPVAEFAGDAPVALGPEPVPIVSCTIGGRAARCLLDSGAIPSAMTLALADELRLEPHGELEISGFGRFATGFVEAGPLLVGPARFGRARFAVVPQTAAARFDAVIGSDLLGRIRLVLERGRGIARVLPPAGPAPGGSAAHVTFSGGAPYVQASFGPQGARALLDTGDQAVVSLGYAAYREGPQWPVVTRGQALGIGGADDVFTVELPEIRIGTLTFGSARALVRRTQHTAHVGVGLWDRYDIDLDEAAGRVVFTPRERP